jgi:hypothetical protein
MSQLVDLYKHVAHLHSPALLYQTKIFFELLNQSKNKNFYEVGTSNGYFSLIAGLQGWTVMTFEQDPDKYKILTQNIKTYDLERQITPIYTKIGLHPSLDHFIGDQPVGIVKIDADGNEIEIIDGLKRSLQKQLIDCLIVNICPRKRPTNFWLELLIYIKQLNFDIFDLNIPIKKTDTTVKLVPFMINDIHKTEETTLLFLKH